MTGYRKILAPIDFSDASLAALSEAGRLGRALDSGLLVLHVVPPLPVAPPIPTVPDSLAETSPKYKAYKKELREASEKQLSDAAGRSDLEDLDLETLVLEGDPPQTILETAQDKGADLIVMGSRGQSGFHRFLFGSVAEKVVRSSRLPVLTVPLAEE
jgi:nucleotide-binding universal stress UspA family protein